MTICSSDTPIFNIRTWHIVYLIKRCNKWQILSPDIQRRKIITVNVIFNILYLPDMLKNVE